MNDFMRFTSLFCKMLNNFKVVTVHLTLENISVHLILERVCSVLIHCVPCTLLLYTV